MAQYFFYWHLLKNVIIVNVLQSGLAFNTAGNYSFQFMLETLTTDFKHQKYYET